MRDLPLELKYLTRLALVSGLAEVFLGFEGLDSETPGPIGWLLYLYREENSTLAAEDNFLAISSRPGENLFCWDPLVDPLDNPEDACMSVDQICDWIVKPLPGVELPTRAELDSSTLDAQLFLEAARNGWNSQRTIRRNECLSYAESMKRLGKPPNPPIVNYTFSAINWYYNEEGHEFNRDTEAKTSDRIMMARMSLTSDNWVYSAANGVDYPATELLDRVTQRSPYYADIVSL